MSQTKYEMASALFTCGLRGDKLRQSQTRHNMDKQHDKSEKFQLIDKQVLDYQSYESKPVSISC